MRTPALLLATTLLGLAACTDTAPNPVSTPAPPVRTVNVSPQNEPFGFVIGGGIAGDSAKLDSAMAVAQSAGAGWMKLTLSWAELQPEGGPLDAPTLNRAKLIVKLAHRHNMKVLAMLQQYPWWVHACSASWSMYYNTADCWTDATRTTPNHAAMATYPPDDAMYLALQQYVTELVDVHFTGSDYGIDVWSVGNEPNTVEWFNVLPGRTRVSEYCHVLGYVTGVIRPRGGTVLGGEMAHGDLYEYGVQITPQTWAANLLQECGSQMDILGVHQYQNPASIDDSFNTYRNHINSYSPGKQLWLTEWGINSHNADPTASPNATHYMAKVLDARTTGVGGPGSWDKTFFFRLDGPIEPDEYPHSWIVDESTVAVNAERFNCFRWYAQGLGLYYVPRPTNCS